MLEFCHGLRCICIVLGELMVKQHILTLIISILMCKTKKQVVKAHIQSVLDLHTNRQYFMAPSIAGSHWVFIMLNRTTKDCKGYIIDSIGEGKNASFYVITSLFEEVIGKRITWQMIDCHQQNCSWECGYYVMKAMYDFLITCNEHLAMNNPRPLHQDEIDSPVEYLSSQFMDVCHL